MHFKDYFLKTILPSYFMIVTLISIGVAVADVLVYGGKPADAMTLFVPPVFGALGCLPLLLDFFFLKGKSSVSGLLLYNALELVMLEAVILTAAYFLGILRSASITAATAGLVLAIFTVVGTILYVQDKKFCDSLNDALAGYLENH